MALSLTPFLVLLLLAILVVVVSKRIRVPYTIALVFLGFAIGLAAQTRLFQALFGGLPPVFTPTLFFEVLLPPIVFEAAIHVNFHFFRARVGVILFLVFVGVIFTTLFTGVVVSYLVALPLGAALLLAAILSPTDPIAVVDLFKHIRVPKELATIVESESLLNDAVGVTMFTIILGVVQTGQDNLTFAIGDFLWQAAAGSAIGLGVAAGVYLVRRGIHDPTVETALTVVAAYGSFLLASALGASGIVSTAIAGIAVGTFVVPKAMDPKVRNSLVDFWGVIVYIANSVIFLAMGLLFAVSSIPSFLPLILVVFGILFAARAIFVYAHAPLTRLWKGRPSLLPRVWYNVITLSGIRGAIPIVLALDLLTTPTGLSTTVLHAVVASVLGVALLSIVVGNVSADYYVKRHFREPTDTSASPP